MPRRNALKDSITIYYAYRLGINSNGKEIFDDVRETTAYVSDRDGLAPDSHFGTDNDYSLAFLITENENTRYFDKYTKVWIYSSPISSDEQADYKITAEPISRDGQLYVKCESIAVDHHDFYYLKDEVIINFTVVWDEENSTFYTPRNMYLPLDEETKLWYVEPDNVEDEVGLIKLVEKRTTRKYTAYVVEAVKEEEGGETTGSTGTESDGEGD